MNFIDKLIKLCTVSTDKIDTKSEYFHKATILNFYSFTAFILLLVFGILNLVQGNQLLFIILTSFFVVNTANIFVFRNNGNYYLASNVFTALFSLLLLWMLYYGNVGSQGILFYSFYPAIIIFLLGKKRGNISSAVFFVLSGIFILLPDIFDLNFTFNIANQILFILLYIGCFIFLNVYENINEIRI